jgi:hypothetical protein
MTPRVGLMLAIVLATSPAVSGQGTDILIRGPVPGEQSEWRHFDLNMSSAEYESACAHNRRLARTRVRDTLVSLGAPDTGINAIDAAVALTGIKTKIPLNSSDNLALELKDLINQDRRFLLRFKVEW